MTNPRAVVRPAKQAAMRRLLRALPSYAAVVFAALLWSVTANATLVDRIVVSVGRQVITLSDVQLADRIERLMNREPPAPLDATRIHAVATRLVDQLLMADEMAASRFPLSTPEEIDQRMAEVRKEFGNDAAFERALRDYGVSQDALRRYVELQLNIMRFVDLRFRPMVVINEADIERYHDQTLAPRLRAEGAAVPPLADVRDRIEQILEQEGINKNYADWLDQVRSQAQIQYR